MIAPFLVIGFLLGMRHALEADHVAAVASLATRSRRWYDTARLATLWGLGHAGVLVIVGSLIIVLGINLADPWPRLFEGIVGVMLIGLGFDVLRRLYHGRIHAHPHRHDDGTLHLHAHSHPVHDLEGSGHPGHDHAHLPASRAFLVGGIHGLAGSAALVLLVLQGAPSAAMGIASLVAFGVGSILGMLLFSLAISLPLHVSANRMGSVSRRIEGAVGAATFALGCWIVAVVLIGT
jgi:cytochrome c biogenesis protein CcdA